MTRIREINANAMARQGLLVDDYSEERLAKLEDEMLIGFEVDEAPHEAQMRPATDGLGLELATSQPRTTSAAAAAETAIDGAAERAPWDASGGTSNPHAAGEGDAWSFGEK